MLEEQGAELGLVRGPELEHPHACPRPCSAVAASTRGSSIARTAGVAARRDRGRRGERHQHPVGEHPDPRSERQRFGHVVRDDDDRLADRRLDAPELAVQLAARDGIERAERLVHQQNRRIRRERARHADALALAARQLLRPARGEVIDAEADERQQLADARRDTRLVPCEEARHDGDVVVNGQVRKERDVLQHVADVAPEIEWVPGGHRTPADDHLAGIGHEQPVDQLEDGALAGAAAAHEGERFALLHREIEALQDVGLAPFESNTAEGYFAHGKRPAT